MSQLLRRRHLANGCREALVENASWTQVRIFSCRNAAHWQNDLSAAGLDTRSAVAAVAPMHVGRPATRQKRFAPCPAAVSKDF
jgi:hypothetical protein